MLHRDGSPARLERNVVYGPQMGAPARPDHHPGAAPVLDDGKLRSPFIIVEDADAIGFSNASVVRSFHRRRVYPPVTSGEAAGRGRYGRSVKSVAQGAEGRWRV